VALRPRRTVKVTNGISSLHCLLLTNRVDALNTRTPQPRSCSRLEQCVGVSACARLWRFSPLHTQLELPRQLYCSCLCGIDHVDRAAIPRMFERKCQPVEPVRLGRPRHREQHLQPLTNATVYQVFMIALHLPAKHQRSEARNHARPVRKAQRLTRDYSL
jgi:hypothetical protein